MTRWHRHLRRLVWRTGFSRPFVAHTKIAEGMQWRVRLFYLVLLAIVCHQWVGISTLAAKVSSSLFEPLAVVGWMRWIDSRESLVYATYGTLLVSSLGAFFFVGSRLWRVAFFGVFLVYVAMINSFGKIGHGLHMYVWVSGILVFLPRRRDDSRIDRHVTLLVCCLAMFSIALFYSMAGLWKVGGALVQMAAGELHAFHPLGMAGLLASNLPSEFSTWLVDHHWVAYGLLVMAILLELACLPLTFRPRWHRWLGCALISMHVGIHFTFQINTTYSILLVGLFFCFSPFLISKKCVKPTRKMQAGRDLHLPPHHSR